MNVKPKTAIRVRELNPSDWNGKAFLYHLHDQNNGKNITTPVVVSSVYSHFGPETIIFLADYDGEPKSFASAFTTYHIDPDKTVEEYGYTVLSEPLPKYNLDNFVEIENTKYKTGCLVSFRQLFYPVCCLSGEEKIDTLFYNLTDYKNCLLLESPKLEQDFGLLFIKVLFESKVNTIMFDVGRHLETINLDDYLVLNL
jgi:hypothetical protein